MNIRTISVDGFAPAMYAMRAPFQSWAKSDSIWKYEKEGEVVKESFIIGENDKELSIKLQNAGPEHCKHLRMIQVWADLTAPREFEIQLDTYRHGVEKISTSTMHTLMNRPLKKDDFEFDCVNEDFIKYVIDSINTSMEAYKSETDPEYKKQIWRSII